MSNAESPCKNQEREDLMNQIDRVVHDMCQPLTTLRCRLELAGLIGTFEAHQEAVQFGLVECMRLVGDVESLREVLRIEKDGGCMDVGKCVGAAADRF